jgi:hypothetical protein
MECVPRKLFLGSEPAQNGMKQLCPCPSASPYHSVVSVKPLRNECVAQLSTRWDSFSETTNRGTRTWCIPPTVRPAALALPASESQVVIESISLSTCETQNRWDAVTGDNTAPHGSAFVITCLFFEIKRVSRHVPIGRKHMKYITSTRRSSLCIRVSEP